MSSKAPPVKNQKTNNHPCVGVGVLLWKDDCLLLGERIVENGEHVWQFPGGHLEVGEKVLECAAREVLEETGLAFGFAEHAGFSNEMFSTGDRDYVTLYVTASYLSGEPELMEPGKCLSWQWFPYNKLPTPLFIPIINFLKQSPDLSVFRVASEPRASEQK